MTFLGKFIVLVNALVSVAFLTFSIGVYTQRIQWSSRKGAPADAQKGKIDVLQAKISDLIEGKNRAEARWKATETALIAVETERPNRLTWYAGTLNLLETGRLPGNPNPIQNPVRQLNIDPEGKIIADQPDDRKTVIEIRPGTPLLSLSAYNQLINDGFGEIKTAQDDLKQIISEEKELTNKIIDTDQKGLRTLIREQIEIDLLVNNEITYLQPFLTNRRAEAQLLGKRRDALQTRLTELRQYFGVPTGR